MKTENEIAQRAREILHYDPETGIFTRKVRTAQRHQVGDRACGNPVKAGHLRVAFDGEKYLAHRLAWLYIYGEWPKKYIDHINGDPADNRIANLRDVSLKTNSENQRRCRRDNQAGVLGIHQAANGIDWVARIQIDGKGYYLGTFETQKEAQAAYLACKRLFHKGCTI